MNVALTSGTEAALLENDMNEMSTTELINGSDIIRK